MTIDDMTQHPYECPACDEEIQVSSEQKEVQCPHCFRKSRVDADADFRNGSWHDLTRLIPQ